MLAPSETRLCGRCGVNPAMTGQRRCRGCHAANMRAHREKSAAELVRLRALAGVGPKRAPKRRRVKSSKKAALIVAASGLADLFVASRRDGPAGCSVAMGGAAAPPGGRSC
jgi:hypothetical protein